MTKVRRHFIFYGEVQGVGFRFTACNLARTYGISGYVRNLYDGTVELEAEGTPRDIDCMVNELQQGRWIDITGIDVREIPLQGGYSFEARR